MIASKRASVARSFTSCVTKLTLARPTSQARRLASAMASGERSTPITEPSRPTSVAARKDTSPAPHPTSSTRMPWADAGSAQHLLGQLAEEAALADQALQLFVVVAEGVIVRAR